MKTSAPNTAPSPQPKTVKPSLADQIAAAKVQGGKPAPTKVVNTPKSGSQEKRREEVPAVPLAEYRAALASEWKELWKDRTSRIVLLGTAWAVAVGIAGSAALYSRSSAEPKKASDETALVKKESEKPEDPVTREERFATHRKIIDESPVALPKPEKPEEIVRIEPVVAKPETNETDGLREKRDEIASTGGLSFSTDPKNMKASVEALKEWSRQDAEAAKKRPSGR